MRSGYNKIFVHWIATAIGIGAFFLTVPLSAQQDAQYTQYMYLSLIHI